MDKFLHIYFNIVNVSITKIQLVSLHVFHTAEPVGSRTSSKIEPASCETNMLLPCTQQKHSGNTWLQSSELQIRYSIWADLFN